MREICAAAKWLATPLKPIVRQTKRERDMRLLLTAAATLICASLGFPGSLMAQSTEVPVEGGSLLLDHPKDWKAVVSGPAVGPTIRLTPGGEGDFKVLITAIVSHKSLPDDDALAEQVRERGEGMLPTATQTELDIQAVEGAQARGYIYHLTDKNLEKGPGDFRELHQGAVVVPPLVLSVTVLTHTGDQATVDAALAALAGARYKASK